MRRARSHARSSSALGSALLLAVVAALVGPLAGPATAAVCGPGDGVSVVVDARGIGGSLSSACDAAGGGDVGSEIVPRAGYPITYVQRQPGFVCRVSGAPASDPCVNTPPADAYWGLFWSDGKSGTWSYASVGITGLRIPAGGSIGLAWQDGSGRKVPGIAPPVASSAPASQPTPTSTPKPSSAPAPTAGAGQSGGGSGGSGAPRTSRAGSGSDAGASDEEVEEPKAGRSERRERRQARAAALAKGEASASATPSESAAESSDEGGESGAERTDAVPAAAQDEGLPLAVPLVLLGLLAALAVGAAVRRRRGTGTV